jgi:hypothetical protein
VDGTNCTFTPVWVAPCTGCGHTPFVVLDPANAKMNVVTRNYTTGNRAALWRCNLDGSGCAYRDINAGEDVNSGHDPSAVIDKTNAKMLVVATNYAHYGPSLYRCNVDGTGCTHQALPFDSFSNRGRPRILIDPSGTRLLVVTVSTASQRRLSLYSCKVDGTECTTSDISAGQAEYGVGRPSAAIDAANGKLLVLADNDGVDEQLSLYRCNLDGTSCTRTQVTAPGSWREPSLVIDVAKGKVLIAAQSRGSTGLALHRCNLDGSGCMFADISVGKPSLSSPSAVLDAMNRRLLVAVNDLVARKPALLRVCVD